MIKPGIRNFFDCDMKVSLLMFIIAVLAYWEISLLQYSVHYDMLDAVLPWRYHVGECLRHNIFPFWNPYQNTGYPIHADLQCPTFYPETILVGSLFGYSNITLHVLVIVYIALAGLGMHHLVKHFGATSFAAFVTGAAFMLSGVFVSHLQHFFAIIGFTWIPWVLLYYLRMSEEPWQSRHILPLSIFTFLLISGGYQALSIMTAYLLVILFAWYCISFLYRKKMKELYRFILSNLAWAGLVLLMSSVILVATLNVYDYIERLSGLTTGEALVNSFTPRSLISILTPFGVVKNPDYLQTDVSMNNLYLGLIILALFITGLMRRQPRTVYVLLVFGILALLASFGEHLPVRMFLFRYFPLMDLFRLPAYFRFFLVIPVFVMAGLTLSGLLKEPEKARKLFILSFFIVALGVLGIFGWSATQISGNRFVFLDPLLTLSEKMQQAPLFEHILLQSVLNLILLIIFFLLFYYKALNKRILFATFIILEMFLAVQLNITYTGCSTDWHPVRIRSDLRMQPSGFPLPRPGKIANNTDKACSIQPLWRNVNIYNKTVSFDGFTSFKFKGYKYLDDSVPALKNAVLQNQMLYLSDEIYPESALVSGQAFDGTPGSLFLPDDIYTSLKTSALQSDSSDMITLTGFGPGMVKARISSRHAQVPTLLQTDYKGWQVMIDGREIPHFTSNKLYISCLAGEGDHEVEYRYKNNGIKIAFIISYLTFLFLLYLMLRQFVLVRHNGRRFHVYAVTASALLIIIGVKWVSAGRARESRQVYLETVKQAMQWEESHPGKTRYVFAADDPDAFNRAFTGSGAGFRYDLYRHATAANITAMMNQPDQGSEEYLYYAGMKTYRRHEIRPVFYDRFPKLIRHSCRPLSEVYIVGREEPGEAAWVFERGNDFERPGTAWSGNERHLDTAIAYSGMVSNKLDSTNRYSYTMTLKASEIHIKNPVFHLSAMVYPEQDCKAFLDIEVRRGKKVLGYYTRPIHDMRQQAEKWNAVILSTGTSVRLQPGDEIRAYIWIDRRSTMWVDDVSFRIGESLY